MSLTNSLGKQLNEMALTAGRKRQSPQTGYIHYFYQDLDQEDIQQTIPIFENACFVLALLRSKTSEQMLEAKELLDRLLCFQIPQEGNFPIYVHEYPQGKNRFLGAQLLPVFYYILREFHLVLGTELKQRLHVATSHLMRYTLEAFDEKAPSYSVGVKIAAAAQVLGVYFHDEALQRRGDELLNQYLEMNLQTAWFIPMAIADLCIALQMVYTHISKSPWKDFWQHLIQTWHQPTNTYVGPNLRQYQQGDEPQPTLYDLFLGYFSQGFSQRALKDLPYHLQAVVVLPSEERMPAMQYPFSSHGLLKEEEPCHWFFYQQEKFAYSLIYQINKKNAVYSHAFHPLSLVWGNKERVHTFVCQGGNFDAFLFEPKENEIEITISLAPTYSLEEREKSRELAFFFDIEPQVKMAIHDETATTFHLTETVTLTTPQMKVSLMMALKSGEGEFLGHLMKGNRPSQILNKGVHRFKAYDWQLFLRTLRRSETCQLKATLRILPC